MKYDGIWIRKDGSAIIAVMNTICSNCGADVNNKCNYCPNCGRKLNVIPDQFRADVIVQMLNDKYYKSK